MTRKQTNLMNMARALTKTLADIVATNPAPALVATADALKAKLTEIAAQADIPALPTPGKTFDRDKVFAVAIAATLVAANLVRGYARTEGLGDLEAKVRINPSSFANLRVGHRVPLMRRVYDTALATLPQLGTIGVTAESLAALKAKIDAADAVQPEPRLSVAARCVATRTLKVLFGELVSLLENELDPQMDALSETDPASWEAYRAVRDVIDQPGRAVTMEAVATTTATVAAEKLAA